ncbi:MAG TPA: molybdenum cofactor guanylyltransferase, partial [Desertimonas sp.]|nr:molybdenum cofactor guanylyltransferase [Desertimonas sp.]
MTGLPAGTGGAVLCGGASRRFGRDKSLVEIDGRPMAEHVAATLEAAGCQPVAFVGGAGAQLAATTCRPFVADTWPGEGPLGGVVDALAWFHRRAANGVVVAACDLPSLTADAVRAVAGSGGPAVAVADRPHPSLAHWPVSATAQVAALFAAGVRSLGDALEALGASPVTVAEAALRNVNRPT